VQYFNVNVDQVIGSFNEQLEVPLTDGNDCDIDGTMLADELNSFSHR